jgi:triosephosphate isomerase (TIM)
MRKKLIAGNWKMNGSLSSNSGLLAALAATRVSANADIAVCVPAVYLAQVQAALAASAVKLGAQDCSAHASGAYTGELSAVMLKEFACAYVIVGHSERRQYHGETNEAVALKAKAALDAGITPIVCVGETLAQREDEQTLAVIDAQMSAVTHLLAMRTNQVVIAYEPVWAIGTGKVATPEQAQAVHAHIRQSLHGAIGAAADGVQLLYGGSMKADNAASLLAQADIDGGLIGGASLKAPEFSAIYEAALKAA